MTVQTWCMMHEIGSHQRRGRLNWDMTLSFILIFLNDKPFLKPEAAHFSSSPSLSVIYYTDHFFPLITHQTTHNQLDLLYEMWHSANIGPLLLFKIHFFWHQPPTCLLHRVSNKFSFSKWQCLRGTVFRHICVCSVWISPFEESNVNAKWWGGRYLCRWRFLSAAHVLWVLASARGGLEGFRGLFPLSISFVLASCHLLPGSYRLTSKVFGGNTLNRVLFWGLHPFKCWLSITHSNTTHSQLNMLLLF